jgi:DNA-binding response OmpR family regulator
LRRLLRALAEDTGQGLSVEALFSAGWPGEELDKKGAANRVRVAITKLRQAGVPVRFVRGSGWSLDVPEVRYGSTSTATERAPSR